MEIRGQSGLDHINRRLVITDVKYHRKPAEAHRLEIGVILTPNRSIATVRCNFVPTQQLIKVLQCITNPQRAP